MNTVQLWLAFAGTAGLLVCVAVVVAVVRLEHRRRVASRHPDRAWFDTDTDIHSGAADLGRGLGLDLDLSHGEREQAARQAVLATVLSRMARDKTAPMPRKAWADTQQQVISAPSVAARGNSRAAVE